ncbi:AsnC family transcriptional regulator [Amylibacter sp. SFDW26]|nr:AsnC family transcriptional regulator [Amylibacter sp. SFDW26]
MDPTNRRLLELLSENSRQSATALGKTLGLSRTAVQDRIAKLEYSGVIAGYTAVLNVQEEDIEALISVEILGRPCLPVLKSLKGLQGVIKVLSLAGAVDAVVWVKVPSTKALTQLVDKIAEDQRIGAVQSQVILNDL